VDNTQSHPGTLVRAARTLAGIGLNDFAFSVGVQPPTLSMWERGQSRLSWDLHLKVLRKLVELLAHRYELEPDLNVFTIARAEGETRRLTVLAELARLELAVGTLPVALGA